MKAKPRLTIVLPTVSGAPILVARDGLKPQESSLKAVKDLVFTAVLQGHLVTNEDKPLATVIAVFHKEDLIAMRQNESAVTE